MNWKKRLAKEWLWLVSLFVAILLLLICSFHGKDIFDLHEIIILSTVFILFVYFIRLTVWAIKELRNPETGQKKLYWSKIGRFLLYKTILPFTPSKAPWWLSIIGITQTILGYIAIVLGGGFFLTMIYAFFTSSFDWDLFLILIACLFLIVIGIRFLIGGEKISNVKAFEKDSIIDSVEETLNIEDIDTSYDKISCPDENCIGIINPEGICSECGRTPEEIMGGVESKAATPGSYTPLKQKSRWGYGWFFLFWIYAYSMQKMSLSYVTKITMLIQFFGLILLLLLYFWLRNRAIRKKTYGDKIWRSSFMAGIASYIMVGILVLGSVGFIGGIQKRADAENEMEFYAKESREKILKLKNEMIELNSRFILSPESEEDIRKNIDNLKKRLELWKKWHISSKIFFNSFEQYSKLYKKSELDNTIIRVQYLIDKLFPLRKQSIEALIKYYETGEDKLWDEFDKLLVI